MVLRNQERIPVQSEKSLLLGDQNTDSVEGLSLQWGRVRGEQTCIGEERSQVTFSARLPGICSELILKPENVSQEELLDTTDQLNVDPRVSGILVQLPLPGT